MRRLITVALLLAATPAAALEIPPAPRAYVTDFAGVLDPHGSARAEQRLAELSRDSGHQVIAVFFPTLDGEPIEDFTIRAAEKWQVGREGLDDGAIFFAFVEDRRMRLEVGYGLEGEIPDALAGRILDGVVRPAFARGDFSGGVVALAGALGRVFDGEPVREAPPAEGIRLSKLLGIAMLILVLVLRNILIGPRGRRYHRRHPGVFWGGGFGGGLGGGFGGGGGFTPGGGGFGGGGASGSW